MSNSRARIVLLLVVAATALAIRLAWLESTSLWWDEFVTLGRAKLGLSEIWRNLSYQGPSDSSLDSSPPLLHFILHAVLAAGGASETWVKLPSVVFGALTVLVLYPLGTRLFGGRAGLYASALLGFSIYHLHYSREARPYSLYLLLAASSLWLLLRALELNRTRDWAAYTLAAAVTLYASYLGGASLAAQGVYFAYLTLSRRLTKGRFLPAAVSMAAAAAAYAPWLPGHLFHMRLIYSPQSDMGLTWDFLSRALLEFTTQSTLYLACACFGSFVGLWRNKDGLALLIFWLLFPVATAMLLKTGIAVNPRYLINFVPGLALLAGAGLDGLVKGLSIGLPSRAAALLGLFAAIGLSWPSLTGLSDYYRRDQHSVREDLLDIAENSPGIDALAFARNRHIKVFARWYLRDIYGDLRDSGDLRYKRVMLLSGRDFLPEGLGQPERFGDLYGFRLGLLNLSPLAAVNTYKMNFSDMSFYREAAQWNNVGPDLFQKTLSLYDPERPGRALWRFRAPEGGFTGDIPARCLLRLTRSQATPPPDATVTVVAGDSPERLATLRTFSQADFAGTGLDIRLSIPKPAGDELTFGFLLEPGTVHGGIDLVTMEIFFPDRPGSPQLMASSLEGKADIVPWKPGTVRLGDSSLYGFASNDPLLQAFLAENPNIAPVASLPGLSLYDPALARPWFALPDTREVLMPQETKGLLVSGAMSGQSLNLGKTALELPFDAPPGSTLALNPGGRGRLWATQDYSVGPGAAFSSFNITAGPEGPCLTCANENSCFITYALRSRLPVREVRLVYCPEAYGEPGMENGVRLSFSTDGNSYRTLDSFTVAESELWEGKKRRISRTTLDKPSERIYLRFELSSSKARLWAGPGYPMRIDAWLDPAQIIPMKPFASPFSLSKGAGPLRLYLSTKPLEDLDRLLAPH
ncbi:MAG: glycosyltransferase family 39 protein [Desulfovibrio sp.]|nr:glycosyltransferase family 39 protein [Desulfovibrio sp.]MBI4961632.1 glycosyltransferase family 39 protein [Desulfovibrio sp.]